MNTSGTDVTVRQPHLMATEEAFILRAIAPMIVPGIGLGSMDRFDERLPEAICRARAAYAAVQALKPISQILPYYGKLPRGSSTGSVIPALDEQSW